MHRSQGWVSPPANCRSALRFCAPNARTERHQRAPPGAPDRSLFVSRASGRARLVVAGRVPAWGRSVVVGPGSDLSEEPVGQGVRRPRRSRVVPGCPPRPAPTCSADGRRRRPRTASRLRLTLRGCDRGEVRQRVRVRRSRHAGGPSDGQRLRLDAADAFRIRGTRRRGPLLRQPLRQHRAPIVLLPRSLPSR
jgi:hypothetical protein